MKKAKLTRRDMLTAGTTAAATLMMGNVAAKAAQQGALDPAPTNPTTAVPVAFLLDERATMIDFAGPWEVLQDAGVAEVPGFELFTVAPSVKPFRVSRGMQIVPDYTLENAPPA